jgi:hypothetical protein
MAQIALNRPKRSQPKAWVAQIGPDPPIGRPGASWTVMVHRWMFLFLASNGGTAPLVGINR